MHAHITCVYIRTYIYMWYKYTNIFIYALSKKNKNKKQKKQASKQTNKQTNLFIYARDCGVEVLLVVL